MVGQDNIRAVGALLALATGTFLYVSNEALPIGLLLHMSADLDVSQSAVGMLVTGYAGVVVVASIPLTLLTRRAPRRALFVALLLIFALTTAVSALADTYWLVLATRMIAALTQALFWAVVIPTAAALFGPQVRGRAVATVYAGATMGIVLGVPAGTWLGDMAGWRAAFLALAGAAMLLLIAVALLVPPIGADQGHSAHGSAPDGRRYALLIVVAILATTGAFIAYTYVSPFLTEVGGFTPAAISPLLLLRGLASLLGIVVIGMVVDRSPLLALAAPVAVQAAALIGLFAWGESPVASVVFLSLTGFAFSGLMAALGARVLEVAPGRSDVASAGASTAVNVGITGGALVGGLLLSGLGVHSVMLGGGLLSIAALAALLVELRLREARREPTGLTAR